jgi:hypothetical protein
MPCELMLRIHVVLCLPFLHDRARHVRFRDNAAPALVAPGPSVAKHAHIAMVERAGT